MKHLTAQLRNVSPDGAWDSDELKRMKDNCDRAGVIFEAIRMDSNYIMLRNGPERDRRLEAIMGNVQKASKVDVKVITHHWTVIPIRRNAKAPGRGAVLQPANRAATASTARIWIGWGSCKRWFIRYCIAVTRLFARWMAPGQAQARAGVSLIPAP